MRRRKEPAKPTAESRTEKVSWDVFEADAARARTLRELAALSGISTRQARRRLQEQPAIAQAAYRKALERVNQRRATLAKLLKHGSYNELRAEHHELVQVLDRWILRWWPTWVAKGTDRYA